MYYIITVKIGNTHIHIFGHIHVLKKCILQDILPLHLLSLKI